MNRIKVLAEEVANRIAAGEVIDRPASVVKELVENAIDAGAMSITVNIERGGKDLIQVIDNGQGMNETDALLSFERHATSKIRNVEDIIKIGTLGFRGEALPSISSISHLVMITKDEKSDVATRIEFYGGTLKDVSKIGGNQGTDISVRRLFSNVPARRKFLKSDQVEFKHILSYLHYQSIVYPEISFRFNSNGKERLNYPATDDNEQRMRAVFGNKFFDNDLISLSMSNKIIKLNGYVSGLENTEHNIYDHRYIFVNGRYMKDKIILHAIKSAYDPFIKKSGIYQKGQLPPYIIFLNIDPEMIDVNVHPAKHEVRFRDSHFVHSFVKSCVTNALMEYEKEKFHTAEMKTADLTQSKPLTNYEQKIFIKPVKPRYSEYKTDLEEVFQPDVFTREIRTPLVEEQETREPMFPSQLLPKEEELVNPWQLHDTYIFIQSEDGLMAIDQHAAHERIIYEKMVQRIHGAPPVRQKLVFPLVVNIPPYLNSVLTDLLEKNIEIFNQVGFSIKTFSGNSVVIDEVPPELNDLNSEEFFLDIMKSLQDEFEETEDIRDSLAKTMACKAAIKANRKLTRKEMLALINDLFACSVPYFCPHGRPLIIKMTLNELEKRFKRIE